ncbi:MAG: APC family permease [Spirochaetia bacterium]|nr:APC family permease [Spirochaetia bacterium]
MKNPTLLVVLAAIIIIVLLPVAQSSKQVLVLFVVLAFIFLKRGYLLVALGSFFLNRKGENNEKRAWQLYNRGWKAGLAPNYVLMLGNLFVQRGDVNTALEIYDMILRKAEKNQSKYKEVANSTKVSRSMALWILGKQEEAIDNLIKVRDSGYIDVNLAINLGTYLIESERLDEAQTFIDETRAAVKEVGGMIDNRGHLLFITGALLEADVLYNEFLKESNPTFPEAYVHAGEVKMALGKYSKAATYFEKALTFPFYQTSTITKSEIERLLGEVRDLENVDIDEKDPIEADLESSLYDADLFDDDDIDTSISDDDELEPNIELDDLDYRDEEDDEVYIDPDDFSPLESELYDEQDEEGSEKKS